VLEASDQNISVKLFWKCVWLCLASTSVTSYIYGTITLVKVFFSEPTFVRLIFYIATDHFVLLRLDTVACAMWPLKFVSKMTYYAVASDIKPYLHTIIKCYRLID